MNNASIWMPLYIGDYLGDTIDLTNAEHGAYLKSMMAYWRKGGALTHKELRAICGREVDRVCRFYITCDGLWHHKRIDEELKKAEARIQAAHDKAMKMVAARRRVGQLPKQGVGGKSRQPLK